MHREYFKLIPAAHLMFIKDDQILLMRRFNTGYGDGQYALPAGHVEQGETATQAMIREASEEIGINLSPENLKVIHVMHRKSEPSKQERVDFYFEANFDGIEPSNMEEDKCDELKWFALSDLPSSLIPCLKLAIENYQNKITYSEVGWDQK